MPIWWCQMKVFVRQVVPTGYCKSSRCYRQRSIFIHLQQYSHCWVFYFPGKKTTWLKLTKNYFYSKVVQVKVFGIMKTKSFGILLRKLIAIKGHFWTIKMKSGRSFSITDNKLRKAFQEMEVWATIEISKKCYSPLTECSKLSQYWYLKMKSYRILSHITIVDSFRDGSKPCQSIKFIIVKV